MGNTAVARVHHFRLAVAVNFAQDGLWGVFIMHALDFGCDDFCCFVPADAFITACAAILRIAFPRRIPVNALHRVGDAVFRIDALLVAKRQWRNQCFKAWLEGFSPCFNFPGV